VREWKFKRDGTIAEFEQKFIFKIDPWAKYWVFKQMNQWCGRYV
jgi:hypothetical protein